MLERRAGAVVNVASLGGFEPAPRLAVYAPSKAFVISLSQALSAELAGRGVAVLTVCPGPVDTPFFDVLGSRERRDWPTTRQLDAWKDITSLARNEFIRWVEDAKQQTTRERRIRRTQEELEDGRRRPCCWPGCNHRDRAAR